MNGLTIPVIGLAAVSGTGKTNLLVKLLPVLRSKGLKVAVIKHSHHDFEIDTPGKDSYELRKAGAQQMLIASPFREALITERVMNAEPQLHVLVSKIDQDAVDLVLVEGFRNVAFPKIEIHRPSLGNPLLCETDNDIVAVASDTPLELDDRHLLDLSDIEEIAAFVVSIVTGRQDAD